MCEDLGLDDLGASDVLDFGCGVKFIQALVNCPQPVRRYVGVDVYREMIEFPPRQPGRLSLRELPRRRAQRSVQA
jgi:hypothetical protein